MLSIDDSDEDPSSFWGKMQRGRVKPFAAQFYSPDYIEDYPWDTFDPSYANKLDLSFAALPPAEQFLRLPKGIVENTCNHLSQCDLEKMLTWLGDHGKAQDWEYLKKVWDTQSRAWGIAKMFNRTLERRREKLMKELGEEEVKRLRGVEKEERRVRRVERRRREEGKKWVEEKKRKDREEEEEEKKREEKRRRMDEEQGEGEVVELGAVPKVEALAPRVSRSIEEYREDEQRELIGSLNEGFEAVKTRIVKFESMQEVGNHNKTYLTDFMKDVGERVEGSIHKATRRLKAHISFPRVADWTVEEAAVRGVIGVLEYVYLPVELKVATESGEEQLKVMEAPDELRAYGAKKKLGDLLFKFFFETRVDKAELVRWVKWEKDLHRKLGMLLEKMTQAGMDRTRMQKVARPFGIKL
ncbi:hypothetical protein B0H65DRAFT_336801 [Neurospora tetraspora]|uniref:Uncharacterized protein n=1 Tax=Neurospora tetraspora TaxID=94610 RepID=A0AAE0J2A5_9PEZI|nr:hypothetical protein B0H65DRAFT_336801 [Neurospora tetraspora]